LGEGRETGDENDEGEDDRWSFTHDGLLIDKALLYPKSPGFQKLGTGEEISSPESPLVVIDRILPRTDNYHVS